MPSISIVIVNWNNVNYIKKCMDSILEQSYQDFEIIFIDNNSTDNSYEFFDREYKGDNIIKIRNEENNGYSGGANQGIKISNGEFIIIMNPDIILESDFLESLYKYIIQDESIAAVSGKLLKYDFKNNKKLNYVDSAGIVLYRSRRAVDRGQNEIDEGQYDKIERVFGVCGASPFYRKSALEKIKINDEYFDEDFFAYKEDIDLSWRLNLYGYKCMYYPFAVAYHGRGMGGSKGGIKNFINNRKSQSKFLRGISFRNQCLMMMKNETEYSKQRDKFKKLKRTTAFLIYSLLFERFNYKYLGEALKLKNKMMKKREIIMKNRKISDEELKLLIKE